MGYSDTLLASGERIIRVSHQHWFVLIWRARWAVLAIIIAALAGGFRALNNKESGFLWDLIGWIVLGLLVVGIVSVVYGFLTYRAEEFVITSRRIIHTQGLVNKRATDSSLEKINDAVLTESIFGRMFGFGDLEVLTASESGIEKLNKLRDAKDFKKAMLEAKHELELELTRPVMPPVRTGEAAPAPAAEAPAAPASAADDVSASLSQLNDLKTKGLITPEEYDAKKAELLGRL